MAEHKMGVLEARVIGGGEGEGFGGDREKAGLCVGKGWREKEQGTCSEFQAEDKLFLGLKPKYR